MINNFRKKFVLLTFIVLTIFFMYSSIVNATIDNTSIKYFFLLNDTTLKDLSGNNINITNTGTIFINFTDGYNCTNSASSYMTIPDTEIFKGNNNFTWFAWVNFYSLTDNPSIYAQAINGGSSNTAIYFVTNYGGTNRPEVYHSSSGTSWTNHIDGSTNSLTTNTWKLLVIQRVNNQFKIYVDNTTLSTTGTDATTLFDSTRNEIVCGIESSSTGTYGKMRFKSLGLFNRTLTQSEINEIYNNGRTYNILNNSITITPISINLTSYYPTRKENWNSQNKLLQLNMSCNLSTNDSIYYNWTLNNNYISNESNLLFNTSSVSIGDYILKGECYYNTTIKSSFQSNLSIISKDDFLIINQGETWAYCRADNSYTDCYVYGNMTKYIHDLNKTVNIEFITDAGDHSYSSYPTAITEQNLVRQSIDQLNFLPFSINIGNHDYDRVDIIYPTMYNMSLRFSNLNTSINELSYYTNNAQYKNNLAHNFTNNLGKFIVMNIEWCPSDNVLSWALNLSQAHTDKYIIVFVHNYLYPNGSISDNTDNLDCKIFPYLPQNTGIDVYNKFVKQSNNVIVVSSAHYTELNDYSKENTLISQANDGHNISQNFFLYSLYNEINSGDGYIQIYRFNSTSILTKSYSTNRDFYNDSMTRTFNYNTLIIPCVEDWVRNDTTCINNSAYINYYDNNVCNTTNNLPIDNATIIVCGCIPNWIKTVQPCINNIRLINYSDINICNSSYNLPSLNNTNEDCIVPATQGETDLKEAIYVLGIIILICMMFIYLYKKGE